MVKVQKTESLLLLKLLCLPLIKAFAFQFMIKGHVRKALNFCKEIMLDPFLSYSRFTSSSHQWLPMTSQYLLLSAAQMHYSVTTVICSQHLTIPRYTPHQAKHMIRETTESSHWKIALYSFSIAPSRKAFTISHSQYNSGSGVRTQEMQTVLPLRYLEVLWHSDHGHLSVPPRPFCTGRNLTSANTTTTIPQTAATDSQSSSSPQPPACQPVSTTRQSWGVTLFRVTFQSKKLYPHAFVADELKMLKLLLGSATILISFYRIDPIPVHAANSFLKRRYWRDAVHLPAIYFHHID